MKDELELFTITGICFFSMIAYKALNIRGFLVVDVVFWIVPHYLSIMYPEMNKYLITVLMLVIGAGWKNLGKNYHGGKYTSNCQERSDFCEQRNINFNGDSTLKNNLNGINNLDNINNLNKENLYNICNQNNLIDNNDVSNTNSVNINDEFGQNDFNDISDVDNTNNLNNNKTNNICKQIDLNDVGDEDNTNLYINNKENDDYNENDTKIFYNKNDATNNENDIIKNLQIKRVDKKNINLVNNTYQTFTAKNTNYYPLIDTYRSSLILMVIISIFGCDFSIFPERFTKTEYYGLSLMDVGIGSFLFNNGGLSVYIKPRRLLKTTFFLLILGFTRLATILYFNYYVNITEYGKHLNFYFVLAFTYILFYIVNSKHNFKMGLLISLVYEYLLRVKQYDVFIFEEKRHNFFLLNKEGFFQLIPSLCIFLFASELGRIGLNRSSKANNKDKLVKASTLSIMFVIMYFISREYSLASRRLGNITYIMWILGLHSLHLCLAFIVTYFLPWHPLNIQVFVSRNMMFVFLWSNLLILLANLCTVVKNFTERQTNLCMAVYLSLVVVVPYIISRKILKNKEGILSKIISC